MDTGWQCKLKNPPKRITVGQKLSLFCDGETKAHLKDPIRIEFLDPGLDYSLYVLRALKKEDHFLALEAVSYRAGEFNSPFIITDGENSLTVKGFSLSVQSLLKAEKALPPPHGPFGPFKRPLAAGHIALMALAFFCAAGFVFIFARRWLKRKKYIQKILSRKGYIHPSKSFIISLRESLAKGESPAKNLERLFKIFLEDCFFIPAVQQPNDHIMKNIKRRAKKIYKKEGQAIHHILSELSALSQSAPEEKAALRLKKMCEKMAFLLESERS